MAITIIPEDGSGVTGSNSYITLVEYNTFLENHGLSDSRGDEQKNAALINGWQYVNNQDSRYSGRRTASAQTGAFPRAGSSLYGYSVASNVITQNAKDGQAQYAYESSLTALYAVGTGQAITKEKVDVIEVEYAESASTNPQPNFEEANEYLKPLYKNGGAMSVIRV